MEQLIEAVRRRLRARSIRAPMARLRRWSSDTEPMRCRAHALAFDMAARGKRGAEPLAHMREFLRALLMRRQDAAPQAMFEPFELLPGARHFRLRRLARESMGEAGQSAGGAGRASFAAALCKALVARSHRCRGRAMIASPCGSARQSARRSPRRRSRRRRQAAVWRRPRSARSAASSARTGTAFSAAAVGVGARRSAT